MTNRNGDLITYNPLNKPAIMKNGSNGKEVRFYYGAGGARYMKTSADVDTYYLGKSYEERVKGSEETQICYISLGGKTIGTHTQVINTDYVPTNEHYAETPFNRYFHTDALGSITAITDDTGKVVERRSYEPFGKIRAMDYETNNNSLIPNKVIETNRAFTGHEQIAELSGLIHMNARVYDSDIGRFLSADTILQYPYSSQGYNRYSYVENNPLIATDPSGHGFFSKLKKVFKKIVKAVLIVAAVVAFATITAGASVAVVSGAVKGAVIGFGAGFVGTKANGGSWGDAFKNGFRGAAAGALGGGVGGYYGNTWNIGRVGAQATASGIGSEITGGEFKDGVKIGAITSASQWLYSSTVGYDSKLESGEEYSMEDKDKYVTKYSDSVSTPRTPNTIGRNVRLSGKNWYDFQNYDKQGGLVSRALNLLPGADSFSKLHDEWVRGGVNELFNYGSMPPAVAINYASIYNQNFAAIDILRRKGGKK